MSSKSVIIHPNGSYEIRLQRFHAAIIPAEQMPTLGETIITACPFQMGISIFDPHDLRINKVARFERKETIAIPRTTHLQYIYVFGASFETTVCRRETPNGCGYQLSDGREAFGFVYGHHLIRPLPALSEAWRPVKYTKNGDEHNHSPGYFVDIESGDPIMRADVVLLTSNESQHEPINVTGSTSMYNGGGGCRAFCIPDLKKI